MKNILPSIWHYGDYDLSMFCKWVVVKIMVTVGVPQILGAVS